MSISYSISAGDIWPRYYFKLKTAIEEVTEWLKRNKEYVEESNWQIIVMGVDGKITVTRECRDIEELESFSVVANELNKAVLQSFMEGNSNEEE